MRVINKIRKITMFCLVFCLFLIPNMVSAATENLNVSNVFPGEARYSQTFTPIRADFQAILNVSSLSGLSSGSNLKATIQKYNPSTGLFEDRGDNGTLHRLKVTTTSNSYISFYATISY